MSTWWRWHHTMHMVPSFLWMERCYHIIYIMSLSIVDWIEANCTFYFSRESNQQGVHISTLGLSFATPQWGHVHMQYIQKHCNVPYLSSFIWSHIMFYCSKTSLIHLVFGGKEMWHVLLTDHKPIYISP